MVVYTETHTWSENTKLWNSQLQMGTFILYPMFPRLRDHFGKGNVEDKRQGSGYDSSKFTVAVVACTRPRQSKFQMVEGESHQDPPLPEDLLANDDWWGTDSRFPSETVIFLCPRNSSTPMPILTALSGVSWLKIVLYFLDDYMSWTFPAVEMIHLFIFVNNGC